MSDENVFRTIAAHVVQLLQPIRTALSTDDDFKALLFRLGWSATSVPQQYKDLALQIDQVVHDVEALADDATPEEVIEVVKDFIPIYQFVRNPTIAPGGVDVPTFLAEAGKHLFALCVVDYLQQTFPTFYQALQTTGVITFVDHPNPTNRTAFLEPQLNFNRVGDFFSKPGSFLTFVFAWGVAEFDSDEFLLALMNFFGGMQLPASSEEIEDELQQGYQPDPTTAVRRMAGRTRLMLADGTIGDTPFEAGIEALDLPADGTHLPGIVIQPFLPSQIGQSFPISDTLSLTIRAGSDVASTFGILLRPGEAPAVRYPFEPGKQPPTAGFGLSLVFAPAEPTVLIGRAGHSRLEIKGFEAGVALDLKGTDADVTVSIAPKDLSVTLKADDGDGFIGSILGKVDTTAIIDASLAWSTRAGFRIGNGGGFELAANLNKTIGPITLQQLKVALKGSSDNGASAFITKLGLGIAAKLGPIAAVLDNVGVQLDMKLVDGNLGPVDLSVGFKPPSGVGLSVNAGPVSGGGFISFDFDAGRYSGVLALQVYSVAVKAIAVIDTKFPDGRRGFSFFIIISAEFQPVQLGFGFTLLGVGGLIGINRDLNQEALTAAVKAGSLDNILFPKDPIRDAPTILADVQALFPPAEGVYAFGPLARIGWGTPAIIDARLGVILVFPGPRIALLGTITALLPPGAKQPELRLVELHMDVAGILDFPKKHFAMDAQLHDSQVRGFPISGDMAARMDWGQNPNFALSMGGFNPHYTPPSKFPRLRRLSIDLGIKGNPSATLQGYMALTSNTAQVGAALEVSAHANGASLNGGLAFDALFVFSPFSFNATLEGGVHVDFHGAGFGMHFHGEISGPAPWHLRGDVCVSVLWWDACVGFDLTLGGESKPELPAIDIWAGSTADVNGHQDVPGLQSAVTSAGNWTGVLPDGGYQIVSITQSDSTRSRVDPLGVATFQQKVAPLQLAISKFAGRNRAKNDVVTVTVQTLSVNAEALPAERIKNVSDFFAPVQYQKVADSQALSSPSFQQLPAGFSFSSDDIVFGAQQVQNLSIQTIVVAADGSATNGPDYSVPSDTTLLKMTGRSATATGGLRKLNIDRFVNFAITTLPFALATEAYVLATKNNLTRFTGETTSGAAYALAADKLATLSPAVRASLQIVPVHELPI